MFDNVKTVTFHEKDYDRITHINSKEPETIEVQNDILINLHFVTFYIVRESSYGTRQCRDLAW